MHIVLRNIYHFSRRLAEERFFTFLSLVRLRWITTRSRVDSVLRGEIVMNDTFNFLAILSSLVDLI